MAQLFGFDEHDTLAGEGFFAQGQDNGFPSGLTGLVFSTAQTDKLLRKSVDQRVGAGRGNGDGIVERQAGQILNILRHGGGKEHALAATRGEPRI
jgi:hypothetical protein